MVNASDLVQLLRPHYNQQEILGVIAALNIGVEHIRTDTSECLERFGQYGLGGVETIELDK